MERGSIMHVQRMIQTTLALSLDGGHPPIELSFVFGRMNLQDRAISEGLADAFSVLMPIDQHLILAIRTLDADLRDGLLARDEAREIAREVGKLLAALGIDETSENWSQFLITAVFSEQIVIEQSPPTLASLASLFTKASGVAVGAYVGFEASVDHPLLLLITVPMGMMICGPAAAIATALEAGLQARLLAWLSVENTQSADVKPGRHLTP